jgi:hypothetical protein
VGPRAGLHAVEKRYFGPAGNRTLAVVIPTELSRVVAWLFLFVSRSILPVLSKEMFVIPCDQVLPQ